MPERRMHSYRGMKADAHTFPGCMYTSSLIPNSLHLQLASLAGADLATLWQKYLDGFGRCIEHWVSDPESPAGRRLARMYWEFSIIWSSVQIRHPNHYTVCAIRHVRIDSHTRLATTYCWVHSSIHLPAPLIARITAVVPGRLNSAILLRAQSTPSKQFEAGTSIHTLMRTVTAAPMYVFLQDALKHILQPSASPSEIAAAAAAEKEDRYLAADARLSAEQKDMLVALREALYTNLGRHASQQNANVISALVPPSDCIRASDSETC